MLTISDKPSPDVGAAFGVHYGYGITDQFNLLVEVQYALLSLGPPAAPMSMTMPMSGSGSGSTTPPMPTATNDPSQMWNADIGLTYVLDVLRWVPYFGVLAGGYLLNGGGLPGSLILPGGEIVVGLDYLVTPRWAVGGEFSEHFPLHGHGRLHVVFDLLRADGVSLGEVIRGSPRVARGSGHGDQGLPPWGRGWATGIRAWLPWGKSLGHGDQGLPPWGKSLCY